MKNKKRHNRSLIACSEVNDKNEIHAAFSALYLPLPEAGEFIHTRRGFLLALPDYGAVMRIERIDPDGKVAPPDHPLILQPVGIVEKKTYLFELCPGVPRVGVSLGDALFLEDQISQCGMVAEFTAADDCGYLPVTTSRFPQGIPVVIDRTDMWWIDPSYREAFNAASYAHLDPETIRGQYALYRPLREAFAQFSAQPGPERARDFWGTMKEAVKAGKLFAAWEATGRADKDKLQKSHDLREAGNHYSGHLRADPVHKPLLPELP